MSARCLLPILAFLIGTLSRAEEPQYIRAMGADSPPPGAVARFGTTRLRERDKRSALLLIDVLVKRLPDASRLPVTEGRLAE